MKIHCQVSLNSVVKFRKISFSLLDIDLQLSNSSFFTLPLGPDKDLYFAAVDGAEMNFYYL